MFDCYLIWGNPRDFALRCVYQQRLSRGSVTISPDGDVMSLNVGPVPISGPIIHSEPAGKSPSEAEAISVLVDTDIPSWIDPKFMHSLGWVPAEHVPKPARYPFQVDILLLASNWTGSFDGWSSTQWIDASVKPLQRCDLSLAPGSDHSPTRVHVLDVGVDIHGIPYAVVYAPDRDVVDAVKVTKNGWRREPIARLRRQAWSELADLSMQVEVTAIPVFGSAVVADVSVFSDPALINEDALNHLPDDVFEAVREELLRITTPDVPPVI